MTLYDTKRDTEILTLYDAKQMQYGCKDARLACRQRRDRCSKCMPGRAATTMEGAKKRRWDTREEVKRAQDTMNRRGAYVHEEMDNLYRSWNLGASLTKGIFKQE